MKILMFTNTYLPHVGGVAKSVCTFADDLMGLGHEVMIAAPTFPDNGEADRNTDEYENRRVVRVPAIQKFNGSDFSVRLPIPGFLKQEIDGFDPDIIHTHHPYLMGDSAIRAAGKRGLPIVFTHHTLYEEYTHYVLEDSKTMKRFAINLSTEYANMCDRVIAPSESIRKIIQNRGVMTPVTVIPTGVEVDFFANGDRFSFREEFSIPQKAVVYGHLGRLAPEKNLHFLTEAVAAHMKTNSNAFFLVVGKGESQNRIQEICKSHDVEKQLVLAGELTGTKLADAYQAMDAFVFASHSETQGMVLTEAMSAGKPVIALDAPGVREVVEDGVNGCLLPSDADEKDFQQALVKWEEDSLAKEEFSKKAKETALRFERMKVAKNLENLYKEILDIPRSPRNGNMDFLPWDDLLSAIQVEWDLLSQKTRAITDTVKEKIM